jgi:hypothetical protein
MVQGIRAQMRHNFLAALYRRRLLVESVISAVKRMLSAQAPIRSLHVRGLQALLLGTADNIQRL